MPPMPYVVTQGNINTALENAFNFGHDGRSPVQVKLATLRDLKELDELGEPAKRIGDCGAVLTAVVADHIQEHWFEKQKTLGPATDPTGWWINWSGPAEKIARKGMIAALEVALGLDPEGDLAEVTETPRDWLMDITWICPVPRFEFWVSWRDHGAAFPKDPARAGIVHLTMATPGYAQFTPPGPTKDPHGVIKPHEPMRSTLHPVYEPTSWDDNGHVVVGAEHTMVSEVKIPLPGWSEEGEDDNEWQLVIGTGAEATSDVVMHRPPIGDGIAASGQPQHGVMR